MRIRIRIGKFSFEPGLATTLAAAAFVALTLWLGDWQLARAQEKRERQALFEARMHDTPLTLTGAVASADALLYRRVRVAGEWLAERQFFVDNQIRGDRVGFNVITPLALAGGKAAVLVNRGWVERTRDYPRPPPAPAPEGRAEVAGMAMRPPARYLELGTQTVSGNVWQNLSIERFAAATGLALLRSWSCRSRRRRASCRCARRPTRGSPSTSSTPSRGSRSPPRRSRSGSR
jgi:surfeit locus 1 family protein